MSDVRKEKRNRNITPSLTLRLRRRLKVARLRPARRPSNVAPSYAVNNPVARDVFVNIDIILIRDGGAVAVVWTPGPGVRRVGAAWGRHRNSETGVRIRKTGVKC